MCRSAAGDIVHIYLTASQDLIISERAPIMTVLIALLQRPLASPSGRLLFPPLAAPPFSQPGREGNGDTASPSEGLPRKRTWPVHGALA